MTATEHNSIRVTNPNHVATKPGGSPLSLADSVDGSRSRRLSEGGPAGRPFPFGMDTLMPWKGCEKSLNVSAQCPKVLFGRSARLPRAEDAFTRDAKPRRTSKPEFSTVARPDRPSTDRPPEGGPEDWIRLGRTNGTRWRQKRLSFAGSPSSLAIKMRKRATDCQPASAPRDCPKACFPAWFWRCFNW